MSLFSNPPLAGTDKTRIAPYKRLDLKVYGYTLPELESHQGCVKVGETERDSVHQRIMEQTGTAGLRPELLFERKARLSDGRLFRDRQLHTYFARRGIKHAVLNNKASEWFRFGDVQRAEQLTDDFIRQDYDIVQTEGGSSDYLLRQEQQAAVEATLAYYQNPVHGTEFLWNAKPRFGKTLTTYDFMRRIGAIMVLIVTNRPAIANAWYDDFMKFIAWQEPGFKFVSDTDALADTQAMTRAEFMNYLAGTQDENPRCVAFLSLQDLKGSRFAGGDFDKLEWVPQNKWDLLVIDEAHEGIDTLRTDRAFDRITRGFTLHLSGTPFKAIARQDFNNKQIYNWSYLDEQKAKAAWDSRDGGTNPYAALPALSLFTFQMSKLVEEQVAQGLALESGKNVDFAFDLNEFFSTKEEGSFVHEEAVIRFLDNLHTGSLPFAQGEHRQQLNHTFWLLPRVAAAKRLEYLLNNHAYFKDYQVVLAAGDGVSLQLEESLEDLETAAPNERVSARSYDRVKTAIAQCQRTITLSVGQLTTGVTIPEWTAVLMLSNIKSPALYFQAAFRAQNPHEVVDEGTGELLRKENAYVFDFAPDRTLILYDAFANNLSGELVQGTTGERQAGIRELINFFPVIAQDDQGTMRELDPNDILTIPSQIKAAEVVRRGFMSNLLFANISAIFSAPQAIRDILSKIAPEKNTRLGEKKEIKVTDPSLDDDGEVVIPQEIVISTTHGLFGEGIYANRVEEILKKVGGLLDRNSAAALIARDVIRDQSEGFVKAKEELGLTNRVLEVVKEKAVKALETRVEESLFQHEKQQREVEEAYRGDLKKLATQEEKARREETYRQEQEALKQHLAEAIKKDLQAVQQEAVASRLITTEEQKKKATEDEVRDHLRGFARTIPAFLMAYGDKSTTLATFEQNIHAQTFLELTSITVEEFKKLRDGFPYEDEQGKQRTFPCLFDEVVFNASVREFFDTKERLKDYVHHIEDEDIFDYIPPQKTNQIFTPKRVVKMMVDLLQQQAPGLFESRVTTFIDLYSKSGLYLSEIAKRLFVGLKKQIPDEGERIKWILERQVYGVAPSNIIYHMIKNYVYAGYPQADMDKLAELDLIEDAKAGTVEKALKQKWGKNVKFDVIIGNPPYQESDGGAGVSAKPLYHFFVKESQKLNSRFISFVIPSRWFTGGKRLDEFRSMMLSNQHIRTLVDYENFRDIFPAVDLAGGACYFLWDKEYSGPCLVTNFERTIPYTVERELNEFSVLIRSNKAVQIVKKIQSVWTGDYLNTRVSSRKPFGLPTNYLPKEEGVPCWFIQKIGKKYAYPEDVNDKNKIINKWKFLVPKAPIAGQTDFSKPVGFYYNGNTIIAAPGEYCTESFIVAGAFETKDEVESFRSYLFTKVARFLLLQSVVSQDVTKKNFLFVPDFNAYSGIYTDKMLCDLWNVADNDWNYIKPKIYSVTETGFE